VERIRREVLRGEGDDYYQSEILTSDREGPAKLEGCRDGREVQLGGGGGERSRNPAKGGGNGSEGKSSRRGGTNRRGVILSSSTGIKVATRSERQFTDRHQAGASIHHATGVRTWVDWIEQQTRKRTGKNRERRKKKKGGGLLWYKS